MNKELQVVLLDEAELPAYQTEHSAGLDLKCSEYVRLEPLERKLVKTGLRVAIPEGCEGQVRPRSGLALRKGVGLVNSPGTIDSDYRGEVGIILINFSSEIVELSKGERIAQLVIAPMVRVSIRKVAELDDTGRGSGGFGSTGTH